MVALSCSAAVSIELIDLCSLDATYGGAEWAAGFSNEEAVNPFQQTAPASEGFSLFQKAAFFAVIIGAIAIYLRMAKSKGDRNAVGYEKTMA